MAGCSTMGLECSCLGIIISSIAALDIEAVRNSWPGASLVVIRNSLGCIESGRLEAATKGSFIGWFLWDGRLFGLAFGIQLSRSVFACP